MVDAIEEARVFDHVAELEQVEAILMAAWRHLTTVSSERRQRDYEEYKRQLQQLHLTPDECVGVAKALCESILKEAA